MEAIGLLSHWGLEFPQAPGRNPTGGVCVQEGWGALVAAATIQSNRAD